MLETAKNNQKGLTLIELLIAIAVIAIVAAIAVPVVNNVVANSRANAVAAMNTEVANFVEKYTESGDINYDANSQTFTAFIDLDGNGSFSSANELIESLEVSTSDFTDTDNGDGTYTVSSSNGSAPTPVVLIYSTPDWTSADFCL